MAHRTILLGLGVAAALAAGAARCDDPTARLLLERAQREAAFTLGVQQSLENARAGNLGPRERLELDARQRDQRAAQDALFYRQTIQTYSPAMDLQRRSEAMRAAQERQEQLSRFRFEAASTPAGNAAGPAPLAPPAIVTAPIPRAPAERAAMPGVKPARPEALLKIRRVENGAGSLWGAALAGDWDAAKGVLDDLRRGVDELRRDAFKAKYAEGGGRLNTLAAVLDRLDAMLSVAETDMSARDAASVMRRANALMLTAAKLVPDITRPVGRQPSSSPANRK